MSHVGDTFRSLKTTLLTVFRPTVTSEFPDVIRPRADRYRANFAMPNDENGEFACIACLACERICPSHVIKMKSGGKRESPVTGKKRAYVDEFVLDLTPCIQCELCVQVCNSDAIVMVREPEQPMFAREDLVLDLARLRANAEGKTVSWGRGTPLQEMQELPKTAVEKKPVAAVTSATEIPAAAKGDTAGRPDGGQATTVLSAEPVATVLPVVSASAPAPAVEISPVKDTA